MGARQATRGLGAFVLDRPSRPRCPSSRRGSGSCWRGRTHRDRRPGWRWQDDDAASGRVRSLRTLPRRVWCGTDRKAARVLERETGMTADTVAKLLLEWSFAEGPRHPWRVPRGATLVVDEAGM